MYAGAAISEQANEYNVAWKSTVASPSPILEGKSRGRRVERFEVPPRIQLGI